MIFDGAVFGPGEAVNEVERINRDTTLDRSSPCVNHIPGHVPRRITGDADYYTRGIVGLIEFRCSRRYSPFPSPWFGYPPCIRRSGVDRINDGTSGAVE